MNRLWVVSIRWKLLLAMLLSAAITAIILFVMHSLATFLIETDPFSVLIKWGINNLGSIRILILVGVPLFIISYILLSRPVIRNLLRVQEALKQIGEGNFQPDVLVQSYDEIEATSRYVHDLAADLNRYLDEMIQGLKLIAEGQLQHSIPVKENHKLGEVADSINQMARQLNHLMQEERKAEQSKNDLITGVSHDLRTPLTSILGFLGVIKQDRYRDEVELRHYVDIAYSKAERLKLLIDDLFEYTRMNNGMPLDSKLMALDDFLQQLMEEYVPIMHEAGITGRLTLEQHRVFISADGELLVRAFANIIQNAMQYGKEGKYIDVTLQQEKEHAVVSIANYGNPIPASDLPFIFDRFYRIDKSRSLETGGTGLGLAISRSIIEKHRGTIRAESDTQRTAFILSLPLLHEHKQKTTQ